jgi:DNA-binding NtrC family response regulator
MATRNSEMNTTEDKVSVAAVASPSTLTLRLVYSAGEVVLPPTTHTLGRGATPIGREAPSGIRLPNDKRTSRLHATIHSGPQGRFRIVDESSRNGTHVNGERIESAVLEDGDLVSIGDSYFVVRAEPIGLLDEAIPSLLGTAPQMRALRRVIKQIAPLDATVLLLAESGCGKEVAARALHQESGRKGPFVAVNCSAITETLAESTLFGHTAKAFSGAQAHSGLFRAAEGGTLFLDEVGELPPAIQPKLLRVLQDRMVLPIGATTPLSCDVRIVSATNRDLSSAVEEQSFRGDLFARLAEFPLRLPPLRERREDMLIFLMRALGEPAPRLSSQLAETLLLYRWPFNVRQVLAVAKQLRIRGGEATQYDLSMIADLLRQMGSAASTGTSPPASPPSANVNAPASVSGASGEEERDDGPEREEDVDNNERVPDRAQLEDLLRRHGGIISDVARHVRRSRKQVYRWIEHHQLDVAAFRGGGGSGAGG